MLTRPDLAKLQLYHQLAVHPVVVADPTEKIIFPNHQITRTDKNCPYIEVWRRSRRSSSRLLISVFPGGLGLCFVKNISNVVVICPDIVLQVVLHYPYQSYFFIFFVAPRVLQQRLPDCLRLVSHSWHAVDDQEGSHLAPALEETSECWSSKRWQVFLELELLAFATWVLATETRTTATRRFQTRKWREKRSWLAQ